MKTLIFKNYHAWEGSNQVLVSDESVKRLFEFETWDDAINYFYQKGEKDFARKMNEVTK